MKASRGQSRGAAPDSQNQPSAVSGKAGNLETRRVSNLASGRKAAPGIRYTIYVTDHNAKHYLRDVIVFDTRDHLVFDTDKRYAMCFKTLDAAMIMRGKLIQLGHGNPHIEGW